MTENRSTRFSPEKSTIRCATCTAFGSPLVPEVKIIMKRVHGADLAVRVSSPAPHELGPVAVDVSSDADAGEVEALEQGAVLGVGDQQELAVGPADVGEQRRRRAGWC